MKNIIIVAVALIYFSIVGFNISQAPDHSTATVDRSDGIYIFVMSRPSAQYEVLGTVTKKIAWTGAPEEMLKAESK